MARRDASESQRPSKILLDELYAGEDDRFLEYFTQFDSYELLKHFSLKWIVDPRPWARGQFIAYLHSSLNFPGHEVVFKRTLKWALENRDDELLVHFLVVLDGLVRRSRVTSYSYNYRTGQYRREHLFAKPNRTVRNQTGRFHEYTYFNRNLRTPLPDVLNRPHHRLFTHKTRAYLRRRVWRYFRFMAFREPDRYVDAMIEAFSLYDDSFFSSGEAILDNWSLMHAGFFHAPEINFTASHTNVVQGHSLSTLKASPYLPTVWQGDRAAAKLWALLGEADSQFIRLWTIGMLEQHHAEWLSNISVEELVRMLSGSDATVSEFAAELFRKHGSLAHVEVATWLQLLEDADFSVLPLICDAMREHITPHRLSDDQLISLVMARPASVARLGLHWLQERHRQRPLDADKLAELSACKCVWESEAIADWAIAELATVDRYSTDRLIQFFDSPSQAVRRSACKWLQSGGHDVTKDADSFQHDPVLWAKLSETPYDEVRFSLLEVLGGILRHDPGTFSESITPDQWIRVYSAVVLCVDRGSRSKPKAVKQLAELTALEPERAEVVLPVLAIAARSIRDPERFAALAALTMLIDRRPEVAEVISRFLPEWNWVESAKGSASLGGMA